MDRIKNFTLEELLRQPLETIEEYITLFKFVAPVATKKEVFYMKLKHVQNIKEMIKAGTIDDLIKIIQLTDKKTKEEVLKMKVNEFFPKFNSVIQQVKTIIHAEETALTSKHSNFKWEAVGGSERMSKFGIYNTLDTLAKGKIWKYKKVLNMSYADIFIKLNMDRTKSDLEYEMNAIKNR